MSSGHQTRQRRWPARENLAKLGRFAMIGVIGFLVDATALTVSLELGLGYYAGRAVSYLCAATTTWYANRRFTFRSTDTRRFREWARFLAANGIGGLVNLGLYAALVATTPVFRAHPVLAVAIGSIAGLTLNFVLSDRLVFRR